MKTLEYTVKLKLIDYLVICKRLRRNLRIVITENNIIITDVKVKRDKFNPSELAPERLHSQYPLRVTVESSQKPILIQINI
jgi:hypothetical protein